MITTNLRIPDDLHKALKESAERNRRSLNSEILYAIELHLEKQSKDFSDVIKMVGKSSKKKGKQS